MKETIEFKANGKMDFMGFTWFKVYRNGKAVTHRGVELEFNAIDEKHCLDIWKSGKERSEKLGTPFPDSITA